MTQNRFGYEWSKYSAILPLYETQFHAWTAPISQKAWKKTKVLDAGCGTGRNSIWPIRYGAKDVVAFDVDPRTVAVAKSNLAPYPNCHVEAHSIYDIPWTNEFDIAFSIGVIHHLADPRKAVEQLVRATKPGGKTLIWVYGREGHTSLKNMIDRLRRFTSRLPPPVLNAVVYPVSFLWWASMRMVRSRHPYMQQFRQAKLWHVHSILLDQLLPEISNYWTREEAISLFDNLPVSDVKALWVNQGSWTVWATKKG